MLDKGLAVLLVVTVALRVSAAWVRWGMDELPTAESLAFLTLGTAVGAACAVRALWRR